MICCTCTCTDVKTDPRNCNGCGNDCETLASSNICVEGVCQAGRYILTPGDPPVTFDTTQAGTINMPVTCRPGSVAAADKAVSITVDTSLLQAGACVNLQVDIAPASKLEITWFVNSGLAGCTWGLQSSLDRADQITDLSKIYEFRVRGYNATGVGAVTGTAALSLC